MMNWTKSRKVDGIAMELATRYYEDGTLDYYYRRVGSTKVIRHDQFTGGKPKDSWVVEDENFNVIAVYATQWEAVHNAD